MEPAVALVFSPEAWVEELHRHCADHGGARVRQVVVEPRVALDETYDTLVVSHRWPSLTPAFVAALHERGRRILGVFDLEEPAGHEHLVEIGVDAVVSSDASMATFVDAISELGTAVLDLTADDSSAGTSSRDLGRFVAVGGPGGTGATEIAIGLADAAGRAGWSTVLVDLDEAVPAVVQRLGMAMEPNVRTAIDAAVYERGQVRTTRPDAGKFGVLGGLPNPAAWAQVRADDVLLVLEQLARTHRLVIANIGSRFELVGEPGRDRFAITRAAVGVADLVIAVASPTPVGVARTVAWASELRSVSRGVPVHVVANKSPRDAFRRNEVRTELEHGIDTVSFHHVPGDRRVRSAAWNGTLVARGSYTRAVDQILRDVLSRGSAQPAEVAT